MKTTWKLVWVLPLLLCVLPVAAATLYVDLNSPSPTPPYTNWLTAATNIQDAVDAATNGDTVLVTNGVYATGGRTVGTSLLTNRVALSKALTLQSVNGPAVTVIQGYQVPGTTNGDSAVRCAYLTNGASLVGFTLAGGATRAIATGSPEGIGGGMWCVSTMASVSNCFITGNTSGYGGGGVYSGTFTSCIIRSNAVLAGRGWGGGAWNSILNECTVAQNVALTFGGGAFECIVNCCLIQGNSAGYGGGADSSTLRNCTIVSNSARFSGGGISSCIFGNCIIYYNDAPNGANHAYSKFNNCCTMPTYSSDSFTNAPGFVDLSSGDFRLQTNSPCINAGNNTYAANPTDLDGNPRIAGGTVDIGAYEFQSPASVLAYAWAQQNGLPTDGSADFTDADGDGMANYAEWRADTSPTNALSLLQMIAATNSPTGAVVRWQSVATRSYWLERATDFTAAPPFQTIVTNLPGVAGTQTYTDTTATNGGPYFYRVGVHAP